MFVKGQKVICINGDSCGTLIKKDEIYKILEDNNGMIKIENLDGKDKGWWFSYRFKTIIQSIDDVVVGMELTVKDYDGIREDKKYLVGQKIIVSSVNSSYECPIAQKNDDWRFKLHEFEEYQPKKLESFELKYEIIDGEFKMSEEKEYEVIRPFTIYDIYKARPFSCKEFEKEYEGLLEDCKTETTFRFKFIHFDDVKENKTLMKSKNLKWLCDKDFIEKVKKDIKLYPRMKLRAKRQKAIYMIIHTDRINNECGIFVDGEDSYGLLYERYDNPNTEPMCILKFKEGEKLSEINKRSFFKFEVVNE